MYVASTACASRVGVQSPVLGLNILAMQGTLLSTLCALNSNALYVARHRGPGDTPGDERREDTFLAQATAQIRATTNQDQGPKSPLDEEVDNLNSELNDKGHDSYTDYDRLKDTTRYAHLKGGRIFELYSKGFFMGQASGFAAGYNAGTMATTSDESGSGSAVLEAAESESSQGGSSDDALQMAEKYDSEQANQDQQTLKDEAMGAVTKMQTTADNGLPPPTQTSGTTEESSVSPDYQPDNDSGADPNCSGTFDPDTGDCIPTSSEENAQVTNEHTTKRNNVY